MSVAGPRIIDRWGYRTHCHFGRTEGNPIVYLFRSLLFLKEDTAPVTRQLFSYASPWALGERRRVGDYLVEEEAGPKVELVGVQAV